jgi:N-methylhydantoinase B/oxoprolinase/acetone carboxylase alpha subunit
LVLRSHVRCKTSMLGGHDPLKERHYIMYVFSGGGYGGSADGDGLTNGCSTIGISRQFWHLW